ncbi:MAG: hypothetical protein HY047_09005 [Acidobacteria bacterium]|nr:hypothetical protein [Acidobacteriota bacterium]
MRKHLTRTIGSTLTVALLAAIAFAQAANPRIGKWKLKQDAPPPALNIMTYEPFATGGMRVTVESTNRNGQLTKWTYTTMFDGKDEPVTGSPSTDTTAVKRIDERTNEITNKKGGRVTQVIVNVLSADGKTINNTYKNYNAQGEVSSTTTAVYEKQ